MKLITKTLLACTATASLVASAEAASIVDEYFAGGNVDDAPALVNEGGGVYSYSFTAAGFTAAGSDKLVVGFTNKAPRGNAPAAVAGPPVLGITYDGVALTQAVQGGDFGHRVSIFYLDGVANDGVLKVSLDGNIGADARDGNPVGGEQNAWTLGLYALEGTLDDFADTSIGGSNEVSVGTGPGVALTIHTGNNRSYSLSGGNLTEDASFRIANTGGSLSALYASGDELAAGDYFTNVGSSNGIRAGIAFDAAPTAIPEPGSLLVGAIGLSGLALRRRRVSA